jgi:hypothetical protein
MTHIHEQATDVAHLPTSTVPTATGPARSTYREFVSRGLDANEAGNLTAFVNGLAVCRRPWTINELSHVLFLRDLYRRGLFSESVGAGESDARALNRRR